MNLDENNPIRKTIEPSINYMGYEIVRLQWVGGGNSKTLQLMAEPSNGFLMQVDDCEKISQTVSAILDVEDIIQGKYHLEVSSPGIDRPLTRFKDYDRFKGFEAKFETRQMFEGRKRFRGKIISAENNHVVFELIDKGGKLEVPFEEILEAKLVLTDELIKAKVSG